MLISSIGSNVMARTSQPASPTAFTHVYEPQRHQAWLESRQDHSGHMTSSERMMPFSIAPPAVVVVERATLVHLRQDFDETLFAHTRSSFPVERLFPSQDPSTNDSLAFEEDLGSLSADNTAISAGMIVLLSVALGLAGNWVAGRPLRNLATAFREIAGDCHPSNGIRETGPETLRRLARTFNEMLTRRCHAREEQSATLAALATHLESQAIRLRGTALLVKEWQKRVALVEDVDLFSHIARQFIEVTRCSPKQESDLSVEAFIRDRFMMTSSLDAALFSCRFGAGAEFKLPRTLLERVMSNLVDNALEHGVPPIEITTSRLRDEWILSIRDHGAGIKQSELSHATSTFVRLGRPEDSGRHWGLGLALVKKLVADAEGRLVLGNHSGGGLFVRMMFSAPRAASRVR
ncbi:ATP-binding protein [Paraburkholderia sp. SG-MS1]|uniref:ATP-binding protein n=1 Tax=Paraburkholderia sp. SG-MS1 TaxID=2023741 RepID=UPI001EEA28B1|nr:sensor histidine kinase [Paraburkholderia sp. SG-MS1]